MASSCECGDCPAFAACRSTAPYNVRMASRPVPATRITRREWTAGLAKITTAAAVVTAAPLAAQVTSKTPPEGSPTPAPASATPEQKLQKAYADIRETSARLSKIEVPMDVEPAFAFRP